MYIETTLEDPSTVVHKQQAFLMDVFRTLDDQKIDLVINRLGKSPPLSIYAYARQEGVLLI